MTSTRALDRPLSIVVLAVEVDGDEASGDGLDSPCEARATELAKVLDLRRIGSTYMESAAVQLLWYKLAKPAAEQFVMFRAESVQHLRPRLAIEGTGTIGG